MILILRFPNLFLVKNHFYNSIYVRDTLILSFTHKNNYFWIIIISCSFQLCDCTVGGLAEQTPTAQRVAGPISARSNSKRWGNIFN